jgi:(p)ppGpp synthase/HD superfamily hydrolase
MTHVYKDQGMLFEAAAKARYWHMGQLYGNRDYFFAHLMEVARMVERMGGDDRAIAVAYLHDILEDTACTEKELFDAFGADILMAVQYLTKEEGFDYDEYIQEIREIPLARIVKIADTLCNLTQSTIEGNAKRIKKYTRQLQLLTE